MSLRDILKQSFRENIEKNQNEILKSTEKAITSQEIISSNKQSNLLHQQSSPFAETQDNLESKQFQELSDEINLDNPLITQGLDALSKGFTNNIEEKINEDNYEEFRRKKRLSRRKSYTFTPRQSKANKKAIQRVAKSFNGRTIDIKIDKKANLIRQLAILLESGMDLRSSLAILEEQEVHNRNIWYFIHFLF